MTARDTALHRGPVGRGSDAIDPVGCRKLWRAVLEEQASLALGAFVPGAKETETARVRAEALDWFGSRSFRMVCALAGWDDEWVLRVFRDRQAAGQPGRRPHAGRRTG